MSQEYLDGRVIVKTGDITLEKADAIVNAANSSLLGGGGVDGAIHAKGGPEILEACRKIRKEGFPAGLPVGEAVVTTAGRLPAKYVIHTVGPQFGRNDGEDDMLLANAYKNSLKAAADAGARTVAFPSVATGVYRFPKERAAQVSSKAIKEFLATNHSIETVTLVFYHQEDEDIFIRSNAF